ncbi:hypothetical protein L9F63_026061, partial [Diploptera punctata]
MYSELSDEVAGIAPKRDKSTLSSKASTTSVVQNEVKKTMLSSKEVLKRQGLLNIHMQIAMSTRGKWSE